MRSRVAAVFREPLVHFLVIGAAFFLFWHFFGDRVAPHTDRITITPAHVERLARHWMKTHLRPPTAAELAGLVEQEIDEEVLYREAIAMGLDRDDLVIRRRLAVKMDFLTDDVASVATPTDEELQAILSQHPEKFDIESLTTFAQVYINRSRRGDAATADAERVLTLLNGKANHDWKTLGDPLPLPNEWEAATDADVARRFGREFPNKLAALPVGPWSGPIESRFGLHLVQVRKRTAKQIPPLNEVRDAALSEWRAARRLEMNANLQRQRRARYAVTVQWPDWAKGPVNLSDGAGAPGEPR